VLTLLAAMQGGDAISLTWLNGDQNSLGLSCSLMVVSSDFFFYVFFKVFFNEIIVFYFLFFILAY
jgi:hypothetical protein